MYQDMNLGSELYLLILFDIFLSLIDNQSPDYQEMLLRS